MPTPLADNLRAAQETIDFVRAQLRTAANVPEDVAELDMDPATGAATQYAEFAAGYQIVANRKRADREFNASIKRLSGDPDDNPVAPADPARYRELKYDVGMSAVNILERRSTAKVAADSHVGNCHEMASYGYERLRESPVGPIEMVKFSADHACVVTYVDNGQTRTLAVSPQHANATAAAAERTRIATILGNAPVDVTAPAETDAPALRARGARFLDQWRALSGGGERALLRIRDQAEFAQVIDAAAPTTVEVRHYDHIWIMIGRDVNAPGFDNENPATWGPQAVWCDPWQRNGPARGRCYSVADWLAGQVAPPPNPQYFLDTPDRVRDGHPVLYSSRHNDR